MSMLMSLAAVSDEEIRNLLADPESVWQIVSPEDAPAHVGQAKDGLLSKLFRKPEPKPAVPDSERDAIDIDKSWNLLHFLLSGDPYEGDPPLNFILGGGVSIGDVDVGYGPARAMTAAEVKIVHEVLSRLTDDELSQRYDPVAFREDGIYPSLPADESDAETLEYMLTNLKELRAFLARCNQSNSGTLLWIW